MATATAKRTARKRTSKPAAEVTTETVAVEAAPARKAARKTTKAAAKPTAKRAAKATAPAAAVTPAPARRTRKTAAKKTAASKASSNGTTKAKVVTVRQPVPTDPFGFLEGSDSSIAAHALVEGGASRADINEKVKEALKKTNGLKTRSGRNKIVSTIVGNVFLKLAEQGYEVESNWKLKPPPEVAKAVAVVKRRQARKAASK